MPLVLQSRAGTTALDRWEFTAARCNGRADKGGIGGEEGVYLHLPFHPAAQYITNSNVHAG